MTPCLAEQIQRFFRTTEMGDGCWLWKNRTARNGYAHVHWYGRDVTAHRLAWELFNGSIPRGMYVCHTCDVRKCVNPDHLFLGTHSDNMRDMWAKGRGKSGGAPKINREKTHCPRGHEYSEANTWRDGKGYRQCRTCHREKERMRVATIRTASAVPQSSP